MGYEMIYFVLIFKCQPWVFTIASGGGGGSGATAINQFMGVK
jgi:hypothetical protein